MSEPDDQKELKSTLPKESREQLLERKHAKQMQLYADAWAEREKMLEEARQKHWPKDEINRHENEILGTARKVRHNILKDTLSLGRNTLLLETEEAGKYTDEEQFRAKLNKITGYARAATFAEGEGPQKALTDMALIEAFEQRSAQHPQDSPLKQRSDEKIGGLVNSWGSFVDKHPSTDSVSQLSAARQHLQELIAGKDISSPDYQPTPEETATLQEIERLQNPVKLHTQPTSPVHANTPTPDQARKSSSGKGVDVEAKIKAEQNAAEAATRKPKEDERTRNQPRIDSLEISLGKLGERQNQADKVVGDGVENYQNSQTSVENLKDKSDHLHQQATQLDTEAQAGIGTIFTTPDTQRLATESRQAADDVLRTISQAQPLITQARNRNLDIDIYPLVTGGAELRTLTEDAQDWIPRLIRDGQLDEAEARLEAINTKRGDLEQLRESIGQQVREVQTQVNQANQKLDEAQPHITKAQQKLDQAKKKTEAEAGDKIKKFKVEFSRLGQYQTEGEELVSQGERQAQGAKNKRAQAHALSDEVENVRDEALDAALPPPNGSGTLRSQSAKNIAMESARIVAQARPELQAAEVFVNQALAIDIDPSVADLSQAGEQLRLVLESARALGQDALSSGDVNQAEVLLTSVRSALAEVRRLKAEVDHRISQIEDPLNQAEPHLSAARGKIAEAKQRYAEAFETENQELGEFGTMTEAEQIKHAWQLLNKIEGSVKSLFDWENAQAREELLLMERNHYVHPEVRKGITARLSLYETEYQVRNLTMTGEAKDVALGFDRAVQTLESKGRLLRPEDLVYFFKENHNLNINQAYIEYQKVCREGVNVNGRNLRLNQEGITPANQQLARQELLRRIGGNEKLLELTERMIHVTMEDAVLDREVGGTNALATCIHLQVARKKNRPEGNIEGPDVTWKMVPGFGGSLFRTVRLELGEYDLDDQGEIKRDPATGNLMKKRQYLIDKSDEDHNQDLINGQRRTDYRGDRLSRCRKGIIDPSQMDLEALSTSMWADYASDVKKWFQLRELIVKTDWAPNEINEDTMEQIGKLVFSADKVGPQKSKLKISERMAIGIVHSIASNVEARRLNISTTHINELSQFWRWMTDPVKGIVDKPTLKKIYDTLKVYNRIEGRIFWDAVAGRLLQVE